eukprot:3627724-Pleurochrysis_carterae.AAC.2
MSAWQVFGSALLLAWRACPNGGCERDESEGKAEAGRREKARVEGGRCEAAATALTVEAPFSLASKNALPPPLLAIFWE